MRHEGKGCNWSFVRTMSERTRFTKWQYWRKTANGSNSWDSPSPKANSSSPAPAARRGASGQRLCDEALALHGLWHAPAEKGTDDPCLTHPLWDRAPHQPSTLSLPVSATHDDHLPAV